MVQPGTAGSPPDALILYWNRQFSHTRQGGDWDMPEVSKTEIGRRFFKMQKEKHVEKAIEKIRQAQGSEWILYTQSDIEALKQVLGDVWTFMDRDSWDQISFTRLSGIELRELIRFGRDSLDNIISGKSAAEQSMPILLKKE